jgi:hypothetical protein
MAEIDALLKEADETAMYMWNEFPYRAGVMRALIAECKRLQSELKELRQIHSGTAELFDVLGIWTGADDLLWDRLIYLIDGMNGYCDPAKLPDGVKAVRAKLYR